MEILQLVIHTLCLNVNIMLLDLNQAALIFLKLLQNVVNHAKVVMTTNTVVINTNLKVPVIL